MKQWIALLLVLALLCSMTACGEGETTPTEPTETESQTTENTEGTTEENEDPTEENVGEPDNTQSPTAEPSTPPPSATEPPVTQPPATQPSVTEPPATEPPATQPVHVHSWQPANYQKAATCSTCGATDGAPLTPWFEQYNMQCKAQLNTPYAYTTQCYDDQSKTTTGTLTFADYTVYAYDHTHEAREGFVWQGISMAYVFKDGNANAYGIQNIYTHIWDYYRDGDGGGQTDKGYNIFYVNYQGQEYECWLDFSVVSRGWDMVTGDENGYFYYKARFNICVPIGFDGIVIGAEDPLNPYTDSSSQNLYDIYNDKCVYIRLPAAVISAEEPGSKTWHFLETRGFSTAGYITIVMTNGVSEKETECNVWNAGCLMYKEVCGDEDGYLYVIAHEGMILYGITETAWLYRYRIMEDGSLVDPELVVEFDPVDNENFGSCWIEEGWIYYTVTSRETEEVITYRLRTNGTAWEMVS